MVQAKEQFIGQVIETKSNDDGSLTIVITSNRGKETYTLNKVERADVLGDNHVNVVESETILVTLGANGQLELMRQRN